MFYVKLFLITNMIHCDINTQNACIVLSLTLKLIIVTRMRNVPVINRHENIEDYVLQVHKARVCLDSSFTFTFQVIECLFCRVIFKLLWSL